ncbi:hypothetical protein LIER_05881 [Lithospermum erythrorhizon]|uniref:Uncharacterized protein n=1 Tax=Lithospermum erythrorhizon TaxID=34254 RepID=A0AAV3P4S9_LITER
MGQPNVVEEPIVFRPDTDNTPIVRGSIRFGNDSPMHAHISDNSSDTSVALVVSGKDGVPSLEFNSREIKQLFNLRSKGLSVTKVKQWPDEMPKFDDVCDILNNGHSFLPGDIRNETKCARTNFLDGDDKFALKVLNKCLFCSGSNDSHIPDTQPVLYTVSDMASLSISLD